MFSHIHLPGRRANFIVEFGGCGWRFDTGHTSQEPSQWDAGIVMLAIASNVSHRFLFQSARIVDEFRGDFCLRWSIAGPFEDMWWGPSGP